MRLARLADAQYGVLTYGQALAAGVHRRAVARRVERGVLRPVHHNVYALGHQRLRRAPVPSATVEGFLVDALWLPARLVAEADSYAFHGMPWSFEEDRRRDQVLTAAGYRVIRITSTQLRRDAPRLVATLRALLAG